MTQKKFITIYEQLKIRFYQNNTNMVIKYRQRMNWYLIMGRLEKRFVKRWSC